MDEATLLQRARKGDEPAFAELFDRHQRAVYRYALYMCGPETGDDIVQETFMAILKQAGRRDAIEGSVRAYLLGIARHCILKRMGRESLEEIDDSAPADHESPLERVVRAETITDVRDGVRSLPPVYREVLVLCELQELDYAVAAHMLQCPVGTIRSRLHRAKALLAVKLSARCRGAGG